MVTDKLNTSIIPSLAKFEKKLDDITAMYSKAPTKGVIGENQVIEILKELKSHTIENVATRRDEKGDIHVTSPKGNKYLIEVKNHTGAISKANIEKFELLTVDFRLFAGTSNFLFTFPICEATLTWLCGQCSWQMNSLP